MSLDSFMFPRLTRAFFVRLILLATTTWLVGMFWLRPMVVDVPEIDDAVRALFH